jgi:hypothetical protein
MEKYDVFLSYSHADLVIAELLSKRMRRFKIPSARIGHDHKKLEVFRDKERLSASSDLTYELTEHLNASKHLVLLISPSTKTSQYVNNEVTAWLKTRDVKSLIFILVEGELFDNLPPILQHQIIEPLYIDLRNSNKKIFKHESLRLIAALLNVDFTLLSLEDLKYRRRKRQLTVAGLLTALIIAAGFYLIISTAAYHWKPVNQPKLEEDIMPVHEIVVNRKNPSIVLFKGINAKYGTNPRPEGESIRPVENYSFDNDIILGNEKLIPYLKRQKEMRPVISIDFRLTNHEGKGEINIYAALADNDTTYFLRTLHFKGKDLNGVQKEINTGVLLHLRNRDMSDLYPLMKVLTEEKIADLNNSQVETTIYNHLDGTTKEELFQLVSNDEGYADWVERWGQEDIIFSNRPSAAIMIDGETLAGRENDHDVWKTILKSPEWIPFVKRDIKGIGSFSKEFDMDSLPGILAGWFKKNIPFSTPPPMDKLNPCIQRADFAAMSTIVSDFGKQYGIILEIRSTMDNEISEEKTPCYFYKIANSSPWKELKLPELLRNSFIIDLVMLDAAGKNFMILTNNKGYFRTFDGGKTWKESNYGEISFQDGVRVKTLVTPSSKVYAFVDRNVSANEGANTLFVLEERNWFQRLRIGFAQLINY